MTTGRQVIATPIIVAAVTLGANAQEPIELFSAPDSEAFTQEQQAPGVLRTRLLEIEPVVVARLNELQFREGEVATTIQLSLFPDVQRTATIDQVTIMLDGGTLLTGVVADEPGSWWSLAVVEDGVVGEVSWPGQAFRWATITVPTVAVEEMDPTYQWPEIEPDGFPPPDLDAQPEPEPVPLAPRPEAFNTTIDLLLFYTHDVLEALQGSESLVHAELAVAVQLGAALLHRELSRSLIRIYANGYSFADAL